jgi:hypothetical protein
LGEGEISPKQAYKQIVRDWLTETKRDIKALIAGLESLCRGKGRGHRLESLLKHTESIMQQSLTCLDHDLDLSLCSSCWQLIDSHCLLGCRKQYANQPFPEPHDEQIRQAFIVFSPMISCERQYKMAVVEFVDAGGS